MIKTTQQTDEIWMNIALDQAQLAAKVEEVPIGAVLVKDGELIAKGYNRTILNHDPSAHAEIMVLREAGKVFKNHRFADASLFVTLEPCVMCMGAIIQARVARLVFGAYDKRAGACGSVFDLARAPALNHRVKEIKGGVLEEPCRQLLQTFFRARRKH